MTRNIVFFFGIAAIVLAIITVLFGFQFATHGESERIFYIQKNEEASNLWMIGTNQLDEPQQLTFNETSQRILYYQTTLDGRTIVYTTWDPNDPDYDKLIVLDVDAKSQTEIPSCSQSEASCYSFVLSPSGDFLTYYYLYPDSREIRMIDLNTSAYEGKTIYEFDQNEYWHAPQLATVENSNVFTFELFGPPYEFQLYDAEHSQLLETLPLGTPNRRPIFSDDGSRYAYYQSEVDMEPRIIEIRQTDSADVVFSKYRDWDSDLMAQGWIGGVILDWHPNNMDLLINIGNWGQCGHDPRIFFQLAVFDTTNGTVSNLPIEDYVDWASWSPDGTKIIYNTRISDCNQENIQYELVIYDLVSNVETRIPTNGYNLQWVGK